MWSVIATLITLGVIVLVGAVVLGVLCGGAVLVWYAAIWALGRSFECVLEAPERCLEFGREVMQVFFAGHDQGRATSSAAEKESLLRQLDEARNTAARAAQEKTAIAQELEVCRGHLAIATRSIADLGAQVEALQEQLQDAGDDPLYRRVGLHARCPDFLVMAARREYRRKLHPDMQPEGRKPEATRRFQAAEEAFSQICAARGIG